MKQQILNLKKKLLIVELPEGAIDVHINDLVYKNKVSFRTNTSLHLIETKENLLGEYPKLIGKLTDITEGQFEDFAEVKRISFGKTFYHDYQNKSKWLYGKSTAKESFFSYLEAQGICFENPFGKIEPELSEDDLWGDMAQDSQVYAGILYKKDKWQEAEQKVWKPENCYIFEII